MALGPRCGLDVHSKFVTACVLSGPAARPQKNIREFATTTTGLLGLRDWLQALGCRAVALESTGVSWTSLRHPDFVLALANPRAIKGIRGRKTDVGDAEWIAKPHRGGRIVGSFIPPQPVRDLRDLTRHRTTLVQEQTAESNRILKVLEDANINLAEVASDVCGVSGWGMMLAPPRPASRTRRGRGRRSPPRPPSSPGAGQLLPTIDGADRDPPTLRCLPR